MVGCFDQSFGVGFEKEFFEGRVLGEFEVDCFCHYFDLVEGPFFAACIGEKDLFAEFFGVEGGCDSEDLVCYSEVGVDVVGVVEVCGSAVHVEMFRGGEKFVVIENWCGVHV